MAFSKARRLSDFIAADGTIPTGKFASGTITSTHIVDGTIAHADLHTDMDLTGKTVLVANASTGDSDTTAANTAFVQQEIAALVDSSPGTLNTLNELAAALGDDANFSTTVTNSIATKLPLAGGTLTGDTSITKSGNPVFMVKTTGAGNNPVLRLQADTNKWDLQGTFSNTNDELFFMYNGSTKMAIDSLGNVGIGTTDQIGEKLTVNGSVQVLGNNDPNYSAKFISGYDSTHGLRITTRINDTTESEVLGVFANSGGASPRLALNPSNGWNVGIGTSSPTQKLEVAGDIRISDARSLFFKRYGDNYAWRVRNESASDGSTYGFGGLNKLVFEVVSNSNLNAAPSDTSHTIYASSTNTLVLTEQGRVGIGTTSPGHRFHVVGDSSNQTAVAKIERVQASASNNTYTFEVDSSAHTSNVTSGGAMAVDVNGGRAFTINGMGVVSVNTTTTAWIDGNDQFITNGRGAFRGYGHSALALGRYNSAASSGEAGSLLDFLYGGGGVGTISITTNSTQYNTTSDVRLKDNIKPIVDGSSKIMAMNPVSHTWKANPTEDAVHGFIAQEMKDIVPESVTGEPEGEEMMQMDYGRITPVIVAGLQDALKEIEELKNRIKVLENK